jgi:hypothetical protein
MEELESLRDLAVVTTCTVSDLASRLARDIALARTCKKRRGDQDEFVKTLSELGARLHYVRCAFGFNYNEKDIERLLKDLEIILYGKVYPSSNGIPGLCLYPFLSSCFISKET